MAKSRTAPKDPTRPVCEDQHPVSAERTRPLLTVMVTEPRTLSISGLRGWGQLAFETTEALTHVVEGMHHEIARAPFVLGARASSRPAE